MHRYTYEVLAPNAPFRHADDPDYPQQYILAAADSLSGVYPESERPDVTVQELRDGVWHTLSREQVIAV